MSDQGIRWALEQAPGSEDIRLRKLVLAVLGDRHSPSRQFTEITFSDIANIATDIDNTQVKQALAALEQEGYIETAPSTSDAGIRYTLCIDEKGDE